MELKQIKALPTESVTKNGWAAGGVVAQRRLRRLDLQAVARRVLRAADHTPRHAERGADVWENPPELKDPPI